MPRRGIFFEESTAELVALSVNWELNLLNLPVSSIYEHNGRVFEVPKEYGESFAAWSVMLLDRHCPGVVETLLEGARGRVSHSRLKHLIDARYPGLYEVLDTLQRDKKGKNHSSGLQAGAAEILAAIQG